jgi:DNA-binding CsgD family transcriptional regulator
MSDLQMTPRQHEVLHEVCLGKSNKEIARALGMAEVTVKLHLTEVFKVLGVRTRYQAIAKYQPERSDTPPVDLTDQEILEEFVNTTFETLNDTWVARVLKMGRNVSLRRKAKGRAMQAAQGETK